MVIFYRKKIYSILPLLFMVIFLVGCHDDNPATTEEASEASAGFLWKATYNGNTAYFLGTIHVGQEDFYPLSNRIYEALYASNQVYVELTPEDLAAAGNQLRPLITDEVDEADEFESSITGDYKEKLINIIGQTTYNQHVGIKVETYYYSSLVAQKALPPSVSAELGIDNNIIKLAQEKNLPLNSLDEIADQVAIITFQDDDTFENQVSELKSSIDNFEDAKLTVTQTSSAYKEGNADEFERLTAQSKKDAESRVVNGKNFWDILIVNRNEKWATEIARLLQESNNQQYFIAAGTLHWFGDDNVMIKLKSKLPDVTIEKVNL